MSTLLSALNTASNALNVYEQAIGVTQNNVTNTSTPGYVAQTLSLESMAFNPASGLAGGVQSGGVESSRNLYAEQSVRNEVSTLGSYETASPALSNIENDFDVSGSSGIPAALNSLFNAFSSWSTAPDDATQKASVLNAATTVADTIQQTAKDLQSQASSIDSQLGETVQSINTLASKIATYNDELRNQKPPDPGIDAGRNQALEDLSELTNITTLYQQDGTVTVLAGGRTPLVTEDTASQLQTSFGHPTNPQPAYPESMPEAHIADASGNDITSTITGGKLNGLLSVRNGAIASLLGNSTQPGDLNRLAKQVADSVNTLLASGQTSSGSSTQSSVPLFVYSGQGDATVASTLAVNPNITTSSLVAASDGPPASDNGTATALAGLSDSTDPSNEINGMNFLDFYSSLASRVGSQSSQASTNLTQQTEVVSQVRATRSQLSGVSLDQEAANVLEYQRAYEAVAKMVSVIDDMTQSVLAMVQ